MHDAHRTPVSQGSFSGAMARCEQGLRAASVKCLESSGFLLIDGDRFLHEVLG